MFGVRYSSSVRARSNAGRNFQSSRARVSSMSSGHESTTAWRRASGANVIRAEGKSRRTRAASSPALGLNAVTL
jgi:hypothetical protein